MCPLPVAVISPAAPNTALLKASMSTSPVAVTVLLTVTFHGSMLISAAVPVVVRVPVVRTVVAVLGVDGEDLDQIAVFIHRAVTIRPDVAVQGDIVIGADKHPAGTVVVNIIGGNDTGNSGDDIAAGGFDHYIAVVSQKSGIDYDGVHIVSVGRQGQILIGTHARIGGQNVAGRHGYAAYLIAFTVGRIHDAADGDVVARRDRDVVIGGQRTGCNRHPRPWPHPG